MHGMNHAANLPAIDNKDLQVLLGTRISDYILKVYQKTFPLHLILQIDSDIDLCRTITYLCEDLSQTPQMSDSAIDASFKRQTIAPPKVITFQGFCKGGFESKLAMEQLECINQSPILQQWYQNQLAQAVENGRNAIMARFYRHMVANAHPRNSGNNAGLVRGGQTLGTSKNPVLFDSANADKWVMSVLNTIKQMPKTTSPDNMFGQSTDNAFIFGPQAMESVFMQTDVYNDYSKVGDCAGCALFKDTFDRMPRGIMPITSDCIPTYTCQNGGENVTVYPVLFGKRYMGTKAAIRVKNKPYETPDGESMIYRTTFYHHIHTYDPRFLGLSYITVRDEQPMTIQACGE